MPKSLLLLEVDRGDVTDDHCGDCRFTKPMCRRDGRKSAVALWCNAFSEWCGGTYEKPKRLEVCLQAEEEAFADG